MICALNASALRSRRERGELTTEEEENAMKTPGEKAIRRNLTFPPSFVARLEKLKIKRGGASDSEILRQAISLLEAVTDRNATIILKDKEGMMTEVFVP